LVGTVKFCCWKGNRAGWFPLTSVEAPTPEKALVAFLEREKFIPDTILEREKARIAYRKGTDYYYTVFVIGYGPDKKPRPKPSMPPLEWHVSTQ
jgi:hypothetical protein